MRDPTNRVAFEGALTSSGTEVQQNSLTVDGHDILPQILADRVVADATSIFTMEKSACPTPRVENLRPVSPW